MKHAYPFVPNMEDCKMVVKTKGGTCYVMDTCCRDMTPEQKAKADREILNLYLGALLRKEKNEKA